MFAKEYQCDITSKDIAIFPKYVIDLAKKAGHDTRFEYVPTPGTVYYVSVDCARSGKSSGDFSVFTVMTLDPGFVKRIVYIERLKGQKIQNQVEKSGSSNSYNTNPTSNYNSGNAKYFTGKVTGIIDGDTIKVDGKSIRFALASTPELNTPMGIAAKKYIQEICPMGSRVTVDEDDGQTQGSYGRMIAKVTCNGVNLNQAIIEKGFGHLSNVYCDKSEFSDDAWSGCGSPQQKSSSYSSSYTSTSSNCNPNYSGICIPKDSPDLDCADIGGSVRVTGSDPHRLDRDGDGIGCE